MVTGEWALLLWKMHVAQQLHTFQAKSVQELVSNPDQNDFRKTPVDFSKLFRPGRLLNALRQVTARSSGCTMDMLRLSSAWDSSLIANDISIQVQVRNLTQLQASPDPNVWSMNSQGKTQRIRLQGILLQGALFDGQLRDTVVSTPPVTTAPQLTLGWTKIGSPTQYKESESVSVPLYTDVTRSEYIATVAMPCSDVHKWNIAAVALFLR
ncbi:hypothetical protein OSTOST_24502 [Ostertagia ostertagi]